MAVVGLGLLCALLLVVIIWMGTKYTAERDQQERNMDQLQLTNNNLTQERDHFQARNTSIQHYKTKAAGAPEVTAAKFRFMSSEEERE